MSADDLLAPLQDPQLAAAAEPAPTGLAIDAPATGAPPADAEELAGATFMNSDEVRRGLSAHFGGKGAMIMSEVRDAAGHEAGRSCDMLIMETWPSRGLIIRGIEIKVSRSDWLHELKQPAKAEAFHRHCDEWWIAVAPGVLKSRDKHTAEQRLEEVPEGWGVLELVWTATKPAGQPAVPKVNVLRQPTRKPAHERSMLVSRHLTATMLRSVLGPVVKTMDERIKAEVERRLLGQQEDREKARRYHGDSDQVLGRYVREMCGETSMWGAAEKMLPAMKLVLALRLTENWDGLFGLVTAVAEASKKSKEALQLFADEFQRAGIEVPERIALPRSKVKPAPKPIPPATTQQEGQNDDLG